MFQKCKYFNDHQTSCSLMIDDLVPMYISYDGILKPWNDWGYGKKEANSLFEYMDRNLFQKFPEIKGTLFIPFESQHNMPKDSGMKIVSGQFDESYISFFKEFETVFDIGFHGVRHTWFNNNSFKEKVNFEFSSLKLSDAQFLKDKIKAFEKLYGISITGGKFPGYHRKNETSFELLKQIGMKWWAFSLADNKIGNNQIENIRTANGSVIDIPSNINGNFLNVYPNQKNEPFKNKIRTLRSQWQRHKFFNYIDHLYSNQLPVTIQEHAQNQSFDGKRQRPNLFDDIASLDEMLGVLRNADLWHTNCSQLAWYYDSYHNTSINVSSNGEIEIKYSGNWNEMFLSFKSNRAHLTSIQTNEITEGISRNGKFIFNNLKPGIYR